MAEEFLQIKPFRKSTSEYYGYNNEMRFSFCSPKFEQCCEFVTCKDFACDAMFAAIHNLRSCGPDYNPGGSDPRASLDPLMLIVRSDAKVSQSIKYLNLIEHKLGFSPTHAQRAQIKGIKNSIWLLSADKSWVHAPPMLHLYLLLVRIGVNYADGKLHETIKRWKVGALGADSTYLKQSRNLRLLILERGLDIFRRNREDNWPCSAQGYLYSYGLVSATGNDHCKKIWDFTGLGIIGRKGAVMPLSYQI